MPQSITRSFTYMGVWADTPPNMKFHDTAPTPGDSKNVKLGDFWGVKRYIANPIPDELWYLARWTSPHTARWLKLYPQAGGGGGGGNLRADDGNIAIPDANGIINVYGGNLPYININTTRTIDPWTLSVNLNRSIFQPASNQTASEGMYSIGGEDFLYAYGHSNTFCGMSCGNRTLDVVTSINNTAMGKDALNSIHESEGCTALGSQALTNLLDGTDNISIGFNSGLNYVNDESDNILIGSLGELNDQHTIRLGIMGVGAAEQDKFFAAGIWNGVAQVPVKQTGIVLVDEDGKCYVDDIAPDCVLFTDAQGNPIGMQGAAGTVLTGMGLGNRPQFLAFQPDDPLLPTVTSAIDPVTGAIILTAHAGGIAGVTNCPTDIGGPVVPLAGAMSILGGDLINTDGTVANTVTINLDRSATNLQVVGGNGPGAASTYKTLFSSNNSVLFDVVSDPTKIDMTAVGGGGAGIARLTGDDPLDVPATAASVQIEGGKNIYTNTTIDKVTVNVTDDVTLLGFLHAANEIETTGSDLIATIGKLRLPDTDGAGVGGQIVLGGDRFFHNYGIANVFAGENSGSLAINTAQSQYCTGFGYQTLTALTNAGPGDRNTAIGAFCLAACTTGGKNTALGLSSLKQLTTGNYNTCLGYHGGYNYNGAQSNNICINNAGNVNDGTLGGHGGVIRIGNMGVGTNDQEACYIAGIYGAVDGPAPLMVICGSDGKLSTNALPAGGIGKITIWGDGISNFIIHNAVSTFGIKGGDNINTVAVNPNVTVNLDKSILQPKTTASLGIYALGATSYSNDRFMHNYGTGNTFLGWQSGVLAGVGGVSLVGIGMNTLDAVVNATDDVAVGKNSMTNATSAARCTCVGSGSGSALTTATDQILIGLNAGNVYQTSNHNIVIGNGNTVKAGEAAENYTTRIGYREVWQVVGPDKTHPDPVNTLVQAGTDAAYMYGIYNKDVAATASVVYVDDTGKLGTNGAVGFEYYKTINTPTITGDGTLYTFLDADFTKSFDNRNSVNAGVGGRLEFVAPIAGKYVFTAVVIYTNVAIPRTSSPLQIMTSNNSYQYKATPYAGGAAAEISEILTVFTFLDQFDKAWFTAYWAGGTKTVGIGGVSGGLIRTYVSGYRMQ